MLVLKEFGQCLKKEKGSAVALSKLKKADLIAQILLLLDLKDIDGLQHLIDRIFERFVVVIAIFFLVFVFCSFHSFICIGIPVGFSSPSSQK